MFARFLLWQNICLPKLNYLSHAFLRGGRAEGEGQRESQCHVAEIMIGAEIKCRTFNRLSHPRVPRHMRFYLVEGSVVWQIWQLVGFTQQKVIVVPSLKVKFTTYHLSVHRCYLFIQQNITTRQEIKGLCSWRLPLASDITYQYALYLTLKYQERSNGGVVY